MTLLVLNYARVGGKLATRSAEKMAAVPRRARERSRSSQPSGEDSDNEGDAETPPNNTASSKLYATLLIFPGIILYIYILYIVLANLLYPCSLAPFLPHDSSASGTSTFYAGVGKAHVMLHNLHV